MIVTIIESFTAAQPPFPDVVRVSVTFVSVISATDGMYTPLRAVSEGEKLPVPEVDQRPPDASVTLPLRFKFALLAQTVRSLPAFTTGTGVMVADYKGGYTIKSVKDGAGKNLPYIINNTMMRIDLPTALKTGDKFSFSVEWSYTEYNRQFFDGRG